MSVVTGVMLITSLMDEDSDAMDQVQAWLAENRNGATLTDVSDHARGGKHPQFAAWCGGFNYFLDCDEFVQFVMSRPWLHPENVVLVMQPENGAAEVFRPIVETPSYRLWTAPIDPNDPPMEPVASRRPPPGGD